MKKFVLSGALLALLASLAYAITFTQPMGPGAPIQALTASSGNVAAATATATLTGAAGKLTYIEGFDVTSSGSTGATVVNLTVTNVNGGTMTYTYTSVAGATLTNPVLSVRFPTPIPTTAVNTNIVVSMPTLGAGNTNATIVAYGYLQ